MKEKQVRRRSLRSSIDRSVFQTNIRQTIHERREDYDKAQRKLEAAEAAVKKSLSLCLEFHHLLLLVERRFQNRSDPSLVPNYEERLKELEGTRDMCRSEQISAKDQLVTAVNQFASEESMIASDYFTRLIREKQKFYQEISQVLFDHLRDMEKSLAEYPLTPSFGADLGDHCRRNTPKNVGVVLAYPIETCVHLLQGSLREEGLFRVGPSLVKQKKLVSELDLQELPRHSTDLKRLTYEPSVPCAVLKQYLRDLPNCLLTGASINQWNDALTSK